MKKASISALLLERYHIGEVTPDEKLQVEEALAKDDDLAAALAKLSLTNEKYFQQYPKEKFFTDEFNSRLKNTGRFNLRRRYKNPPLIWGFCAAALILVIAFPVLIFRNLDFRNQDFRNQDFRNQDFRNHEQNEFSDRMKGGSRSESSVIGIKNDNNNSNELSVYVRENLTEEVIRLSDKSGVREGDTVQLVYRVSSDKHGVIFSVDGRSYVTLHYPYNIRQSTQLISGKNVPLDEAYTLDDSPDYEIFFFVTSDNQMNVRYILDIAGQLALQIKDKPEEALQIGVNIFKEYEVNMFTLIKE